MKTRIVLVTGAPGDYVSGPDLPVNLSEIEVAEIVTYRSDYNYRSEAAGIWLRQLDADAFLMTEAVA